MKILTIFDSIMYCTLKILFSKFANWPLFFYFFILDNLKLKILFKFFFIFIIFYSSFSSRSAQVGIRALAVCVVKQINKQICDSTLNDNYFLSKKFKNFGLWKIFEKFEKINQKLFKNNETFF